MSHRDEDISKLASKLCAFLDAQGWLEKRHTNGLHFYSPPESLGIRGKYSVALPDDASRPGMDTLLYDVAESLQEIYGYSSIGALLEQAITLNVNASQVRFVSRFVDLTTRSGVIPLYALGEYLIQLEKGLYNSAKFKLGGDGSNEKAIAQRFAKECQFLQTREGSFVVSIEVPATILRQRDLFGHAAVESAQVCSSMFSALDFLNQQVLNDKEDLYSDEALADAMSLFDIELLDALAKMIIEPNMQMIDFTLEAGSSLRTSSTGNLTEEKVEKLKEYVAYIKKNFLRVDDVEVTGSIVELRSRDPEGNRNYIMVVTQYQGERTFVSAILDNDQYQKAVDAHKRKRSVTLRGSVTRLKTQIRMIEISEFFV